MLEELKKYGFLQAVVIVVVIGAVLFLANTFTNDTTVSNTSSSDKDVSQIEKKNKNAREESDFNTEQGKIKDGVVSIKAKKGDSQTLIVRQTVIDYAESNDLDLSPAQIIFAETTIVQQMGADDVIDVGQSISVSLGAVEKVVDSSFDLTPNQIAAWNVYAQNTNLA